MARFLENIGGRLHLSPGPESSPIRYDESTAVQAAQGILELVNDFNQLVGEDLIDKRGFINSQADLCASAKV